MVKKRRLIHSDSVPMSRINELSDDVLVLTLSKLTMKEAARTSVLSHRWKNLWVYYAGSLNFHPVHPLELHELSSQRPKLVRWVNHVLNLHRGSTVYEFRVCIDLDVSRGDHIERWIKFAMEKRVSRLELDFSAMNGTYIRYDGFRFPPNLLDSLNNSLRPFGSLTSLRLNSVNLSDEVLAYFILNCQSLEHLSIIGASSLTYLNATIASKLKHLEIGRCHGLQYVDISDTNIESLKFNSDRETLSSLKKLHLLSALSLVGEWCFRVVWDKFETLPISQLQRLELDLGLSVHRGVIEFAEVFPTFCNLKHLKISLVARHYQNIFCLTSLICASPLLNSFTMKLKYRMTSPNMYLFEMPNCEWRHSEERVHECLKVVEFIGWHGYNSELDLVYYLILRSVVLEKVIIDPKLPHFLDARSDLDPTEEVSRDRAKFLQKYVPLGTEFLIL